ncbi:MAG TPA: FimV/HubP family polar landmark protein [Povalibacter sp.]|uniref:FimV/HubP family polar landmark protein n=1 Tax=Povalibacter sp. TaxID=1962978 RepID=UPI002BBB5C9D|nr:FimV/HubP family polar landmark protein [Povalibacter sp.]HMN45672.1 FimV/HubP family polar landmark protein [Povalibacter sp.]
MRRYLPRLLLTGAMLSPTALYALGLGEIRLNSALNQPFDADIEVIAPTREELAELKVTLASNEMFARYGIDRPAYLSNFDFAVSRTRDGQVTIKVTSNRSVTEPFVTILVEASWGRGRLLREYTVLLDPPVFMPSQPEQNRPVTAPESGARTEGRIERAPAEPTRPVPAPESVTQEEPTAPVSAPAAVGGTYEVQRNDTLSRIARQVNPSASAGAQNQTMIALFRANPEAFAGNINRLKAGSVLRVPDLAEIESISRSEASAEVAQQQEAWSSSFRTASEDESTRLRLVTPEEPAAPAVPVAPAAEQTPAASAGTGSATTPAAEDKRLQVASPGLSDVQQGVSETPPAAQPETPVEQAPAAETPTEAAPAPAEEPAQATRPVRPQPQPVEAPAPSLIDRIGEFFWVPIVAGLLLVIGLIFMFLKRRREANEGPDLDAFAPAAFEPRFNEPARAAATASRSRADVFSVDDDIADEPLADFEDEPAPVTSVRKDTAVRPAAAPVAIAEPKPVDDTLSSETSVRFDQQDALAEADFHMAYGLYDQAADLVKIAIEREPERRDLKLKLLEIYFVWGNRDLFLDTARELHATRDQEAAGEWDKVAIMGRQIAAEDPMFKADGSAGRVDLVDVNLEGGENRVDLDLFAEPEADAGNALDMEFGSGERKAAGGSSDLDFLLDEPQPERDDEPTREIDPLARTQETPTIESPMLDRSAQTVRDKLDEQLSGRAEQTAELSLDDLGLDVDSLETTGALEQTASLEKDIPEDDEPHGQALRDDEMTQLAPSLGSLDRTMEAPRVEKFDIESTGTVYIDQVDLGGGDTVEQPRMDIDSTAQMKTQIARGTPDLDVDLDSFGESALGGDTLRQPVADVDKFSDDVFADRTSEFQKIDLDVGEALGADDHAPTNKQVITTEMELSELEPVTMSEVGTKLDLARAYMDMGDPDGARSILEEVLQEGTSNQKQEAQRLLDSIR